MKTTIALLFVFAILFACKDRPQQNEQLNEAEQQSSVEVDDSKIGRQNYAVVWEWATNDKQLVEDNLVAISNEMTESWKNGDIENAYYNPDSKIDKFEYFPNISYFLKANSLEAAQTALNDYLIVKKGIAKYSIYPVGTKWYGRKTDAINKKGITNSYVSVWSTLKNTDQDSDAELLVAQSDAIAKLYNEGSIENVYWELSGEPNAEKRRTNQITDFVFFVNANTEEEAKNICDNLPLTKKGMVSYKLRPVGAFWFGEYEDTN